MRKIIHETDCPLKHPAFLKHKPSRKIIHETDCPLKPFTPDMTGGGGKIIHETDCPLKRLSLVRPVYSGRLYMKLIVR